MTGWDLVDRVRQAHPRTLFILAIGSDATIEPDDAHGQGVHDLFAKPHRDATLRASITSALSSRPEPHA